MGVHGKTAKFLGNFALADQSPGEKMLIDVLLPGVPEAAALAIDEHDRHRDGFSGLNKGEHFEVFVHRSESAGEQGDGVTRSDEHQLAREEVFEVDELW